MSERRAYPSDLSDEQWALIGPFLQAWQAERPSTFGTEGGCDLRDVVNAQRYQHHTGCQWAHLPRDLPPGSVAYYHAALWRLDGTDRAIGELLRCQASEPAGRGTDPATAPQAPPIQAASRTPDGSTDAPAGTVGGTSARCLTFPQYAAQWCAARAFSWANETRHRIPGNINLHLGPAFPGPISDITPTGILEWISTQLTGDPPIPVSSVRLYYDLLNTILNSAQIDGVIPVNPCKAINIASVFRGLVNTPRWIPTEQQVLRLFDVVPERYHAALWLGAGQGCRIGEVLALEDSPRCFELQHGELHITQQLQHDTDAYGGFFLKTPKSESVGTVELESEVQNAIVDHLAFFGTTDVELVDATTPVTRRRTARLLFTDAHGRPFHDSRWSQHWTRWRQAAGWPARHGTFHALRHFCATTMLADGVDPQHVQKTLRHANVQFTLRTYVHWLPRHQRPTNVVSRALHTAATKPPAGRGRP